MTEWVRALAWAGDRMVPGQVRIPLRKTLLRNFGSSIYPALQCLTEETLKALGPFYLVPMPGEVKYPTSLHWNV